MLITGYLILSVVAYVLLYKFRDHPEISSMMPAKTAPALALVWPLIAMLASGLMLMWCMDKISEVNERLWESK